MSFHPTLLHILTLSLLIHLILIAYAVYHDARHALKYTDVDYRVISDAAALIWDGREEVRARGWLVELMGWKIGDPYLRPTFRYPPTLPLLLSPVLFSPSLGKLLLTSISLLLPPLLLSPPLSSPPLAVHALWTLNPLILNITTRGSPEAIPALLVLAALVAMKRGNEGLAAATWAGGVYWKIYPVVYGASLFSVLHGRDGGGWVSWRKVRFGLISGGMFGGLVLINWTIWGYPFLYNTYLYHLHRLDHRHNFSSYFYPIYLSLFPSFPSPSPQPSSTLVGIAQSLSSLAAFGPQMSLAALAGFALPRRTTLEFTWFVQTWVFVGFNKVVTSQYFVWYIFLIPPILPHLHMTPRKAITLITTWIAAQALWLSLAYQLEFRAKQVFLPLWAAGVGFLVVQGWVLVEVLRSYDRDLDGREVKGVEMVQQLEEVVKGAKVVKEKAKKVVRKAVEEVTEKVEVLREVPATVPPFPRKPIASPAPPPVTPVDQPAYPPTSPTRALREDSSMVSDDGWKVVESKGSRRRRNVSGASGASGGGAGDEVLEES